MKHRIETYTVWTPWGMLTRAYSDTLGADTSPYGDGKTQEEAITDLEWRLEELDDEQ
jgi:hypothetical protein